jgi:hypothetical protein
VDHFNFYDHYPRNHSDQLEVKAKEWWLRFLDLPYKPDDYELFIILSIGKMGFGKSTLQYAITWWLNNIPGNRGNVNSVLLKDLRPLYNRKYEEYWKKPIQVLNFDDAGRHWDARSSMSNKEKTNDLYEIRHIYKERMKYGKRGQIFIIFSAQTLKLIDLRIRENYDIIVLQNYYNTRWFEDLFFSSEIKRFAKDFTRDISSFKDKEKKKFCIGRNSVGDEFSWSVPFKDIDPDEPEKGLQKISKLLQKYELLLDINMHSLEEDILLELEKDLIEHNYFEIKSTRELNGWLERIAREKHNTDELKVEFSKTDFNDLITKVSDIRYNLNLDKREEFFNEMQAHLPERFPYMEAEKLDKLVLYVKQLAQKKEYFFIKDKVIADMIKKFLFFGPKRDTTIVYKQILQELSTNIVMEYKKGPIKSYIRSLLREKTLPACYFSREELISLIEDANYEYKKKREKKKSDPRSLISLKQRIISFLITHKMSTIAHIVKNIQGENEQYRPLYDAVKTIIYRNPNIFSRDNKKNVFLNQVKAYSN